MRTWVIIAVILVIVVAAYFWWRRSEAKKQEKAERAIYGGRTREETQQELFTAWKNRWIEATVNMILNEPSGEAWRSAIEAEAIKHGDTTPIADLAQKHAVMGWAKDNPKANDTTWGKAFIWTYVKNKMNMNPNGADIQEIMKTI